MQARWRFRLIGRDLKGTYVMADAIPLERSASDLEALEKCRDLMTAQLVRVEAVSVGCPSDISDFPGRLQVLVSARVDGRGWTLHGEFMHGSWHRSLEDAVSYGASRTAGYESETRIRNVRGLVTHIVLIPAAKRRMTLY
jgi:hypothetical protein